MRASARPRQPLGGLVAAALPPPRGSRPLPGLGAVREPEGGPSECERSRAPAPRGAPGLCASWSFVGCGGGVSRAGASERPVLVGERVCACHCRSRPLAGLLGSPLPLLPRPLALPAQTQPPVHARNPTPPAPRPGGRQGAGPRRRGGRSRLLPPRRFLPLPRLTLPPWEGCLEGSGRPKPKPRSASYDQLGVCLLLPRAQVWEQASVQNMSEGGDGQGRGVGEDHHQRGRHAT